MGPANFYASGPLDRASHRRPDTAWLAERLSDPESRFAAMGQGGNLVSTGDQPEAVLLSPEVVGRLTDLAERDLVFLGLASGAAVFAVDLPAGDQPGFADLGRFEDLRRVGPLLGRADASLLAYARGLLRWQRTHRFCGLCGGLTASRQGGHLRACTDDSCGAEHFPRTDPAVIMAVCDDRDRCLLGRQSTWPPGVYSTLAGFVEPGESLEDAVRREVMEEAGVSLATVSYHSSQPWPFPASIMLGFMATAADTAVRVNHDELEDARWFTRQELSDEGSSPRLPRRDSISRRLILEWLDPTQPVIPTPG